MRTFDDYILCQFKKITMPWIDENVIFNFVRLYFGFIKKIHCDNFVC